MALRAGLLETKRFPVVGAARRLGKVEIRWTSIVSQADSKQTFDIQLSFCSSQHRSSRYMYEPSDVGVRVQ